MLSFNAVCQIILQNGFYQFMPIYFTSLVGELKGNPTGIRASSFTFEEVHMPSGDSTKQASHLQVPRPMITFLLLSRFTGRKPPGRTPWSGSGTLFPGRQPNKTSQSCTTCPHPPWALTALLRPLRTGRSRTAPPAPWTPTRW